MIRVVMLGRTGNNLFQYALGRVLAEKHGVPLVMDGSWFDPPGWASVSCLRRLGLKAEIRQRSPFMARALRRLTGRHYWELAGFPVLKESPVDLRFAPRFLEAPSSVVLMGYFQTHLYFAGFEDVLRDELRTDRLPWQDATRRVADLMEPVPSVAVHVRRTDYVGNPDVDVCSLAYYRRAMDLLRSQIAGARFFLFSDDPAWCHDQLGGDDAEVCALPEAQGDPLHDLHLMSRAKHHIIANSSYSWWAAWLGKKQGQRVLMPDLWYRGGMLAPIAEKRLPAWEIVETGLLSPP
ncbi:alpha-1,2-fucosyltransferase [Luteolibacter sp. GHJ8]|uniref:Alpha-1,2-fucosyltransferase n=1 Tax=Luteolibacter rhizosphaerae TaxID=2989719 RepID=A0ABT3FZ44_9BACT|nr:alpha-1,2-fucosyltransferase [Luteolibacter rhizosphaerae]MCW1912692.1 alpha-1,2-fucosyltransferase [Luteolibacter rhizosphaerae]